MFLSSIKSITAFAALSVLLNGCSSSPPKKVEPCGGSCSAGEYCCEKTNACELNRPICQPTSSCQPGYVMDEKAFGDGPFMDPTTCEPTPVVCGCKRGSPVKPGFLGQHSDLIAVGKRLLLSTYDRTFGDLVLLSTDQASIEGAVIKVIDGAPDSPIVNDPEGYRGGVVAHGEDVGKGTSLTTDSTGTVFIAYYDAGSKALKLARRDEDGNWTKHTIAAPAATPGNGSLARVGRHQDIKILSGRPSVLFTVEGLRQADGSMASELRWAWATKSAPTSAADWSFQGIERGPMPCADLCDAGEACFASADNSPSLCQAVATDCTPKCDSGTACFQGSCGAILDKKSQAIPRTLGQWPSQMVVNGALFATYFDGFRGELRAAHRPDPAASASWISSTAAKVSGQRVGLYATSAADTRGIHVLYQNETRQNLHYVLLEVPSLKALATETVDDGVRADGRHPVGADVALVVTAGGAIRIVYQDQKNVDLLTASRTGDNTWEPRQAGDANLGRLLKGGTPGYGFFSTLAAEGEQVFGVTSYFDPKAPHGGGFELFTLP